MSGDDGLSLVEIIVAGAILTIVLAALAGTLVQAGGLARDDRNRTAAANVAARQIETLRSTPLVSMPIGGADVWTETVGGIDYQVRQEVSWVPVSATTGPCQAPTSGPGSSPAYLRADVTVTWPRMAGARPVRTETIIHPSLESSQPYSGHVGVVVRDRDGQPAEFHYVELRNDAGIPTGWNVTDGNGCVFVPFQDPGSYTVALSTTLSGEYVDRASGDAAPEVPVTITTGETTKIEFEYDEAATLVLVPVPDFGGAVPGDMTYTLRNTAISTTGMKAFAGTGQPRQIDGLFPYHSGYQAWAGGCETADPQANGGPTAPTLVAEPGAITTGDIRLGSVVVTVVDDAFPVVGEAVRAVSLDCTEEYDLGSTDATGQVRAALPFGNWSVEAEGEAVAVALVADPAITAATAVLVEVD